MKGAPWIELSIERLAESGEGVGFTQGGLVLVRGAMPGDRVRVQLTKRSANAHRVEWVEPSPDRLVPRCAVAERCGGCSWQHVPRSMQRDARLDAVRRALPRALREREIVWHESELEYGYRTRARLPWNVSGARVSLGHFAAGSHDIVNMDTCPVFDESLARALPALARALARIGGEGEVFVARGRDALPVATMRARKPVSADGFTAVDWLVDQGFAGVELYAPGASVPAVSGDPRPIIEGADGEPLLLAPEGFAQANERLNRALVSTVVDRARCTGRKVLELFAGAGNFTVALARAAKKVSAVELDARAVAALRQNVARRALHHVSARECSAEEAAASHKSFDVVVMDPPRAGAAGVIDAFSTHAPRRLVYVSCEPSTFGRDAGRLLDRGMELESIDAFEMFPQTPHVELVAAFSAKRGRP